MNGQFKLFLCPTGHWFSMGILFAVATTAIGTAAEPTTELQIRVNEERKSKHFGRICVTGVDRSALARLRQSNPDLREWRRLFSVKLQPPSSKLESEELPNVSGRYELLETGFRFTPRFAPTRGLKYLVRVKIDGHSPATGTFVLNDASSPVPVTTKVNTIYPSAATIPENTLRLYVHFSRPMRRGQVAKRIRLLDENSEVVEGAFIIGPLGELWDGYQRRLTLLLDPGRIKRGVDPNRRLGLALLAGRERTLIIDGQFTDAEGRSLDTECRKTYRIVGAVRDAVQPKKWTIAAPETNSRAPLRLRFPRALDHGMLSHAIRVYDDDEGAIDGRANIAPGETEWSFTPAKQWKSGSHSIRVAANLEDISGNNLVSPLDVAVKRSTSRSDRPIQAAQIERLFSPIESVK